MTISAKYDSICPSCNQRITPGETVNWERGSTATHVKCPVSKNQLSDIEVGQLLERHGRERVEGHDHNGESRRTVTLGNVQWHSDGRRCLVVRIEPSYYHSEDDCEDNGCFCFDYGRRYPYRAIGVTMTAAEREQDEARALVAREKAEAARIDAEAKRIESERVRALWAFANGSCPEGYVAVGGADRPDGEPIFIESAKDHIGNYAYYYQIGEYRFMSHGYSDDDRRTLFVPDHLVEGWMTAACGKRGITGESAKAYIEKFKGCYGSAIYEWAAANLPEVA